MEFDECEVEIVKSFYLIIFKLVMYVCNVMELDVISGNVYVEVFCLVVKDEKVEVLIIGVKIEVDIIEFEIYEEWQFFFGELNFEELGVN